MDQQPVETVHDDSEHNHALRRRIITQGVVALGLLVGLLSFLLLSAQDPDTTEPTPVARAITRIGPSVSSGRDVAVTANSAPSLAEQAEEMLRQSSEAAAVEQARFGNAEAVPEGTAEPTVKAPPAPIAPAAAPAKKPAETVKVSPPAKSVSAPAVVASSPRLAIAPSAPSPLPSTAPGFVLQMGVFFSNDNAEKLRDRLSQANIPTRIESHVHVGPFRTREEALAAQKRLQTLGMDKGMLLDRR